MHISHLPHIGICSEIIEIKLDVLAQIFQLDCGTIIRKACSKPVARRSSLASKMRVTNDAISVPSD